MERLIFYKVITVLFFLIVFFNSSCVHRTGEMNTNTMVCIKNISLDTIKYIEKGQKGVGQMPELHYYMACEDAMLVSTIHQEKIDYILVTDFFNNRYDTINDSFFEFNIKNDSIVVMVVFSTRLISYSKEEKLMFLKYLNNNTEIKIISGEKVWTVKKDI